MVCNSTLVLSPFAAYVPKHSLTLCHMCNEFCPSVCLDKQTNPLFISQLLITENWTQVCVTSAPFHSIFHAEVCCPSIHTWPIFLGLYSDHIIPFTSRPRTIHTRFQIWRHWWTSSINASPESPLSAIFILKKLHYHTMSPLPYTMNPSKYATCSVCDSSISSV